MRIVTWLVLLVLAAPALADDLPRAGDRPLEQHPGLAVEYGTLKVDGGVRLRTIFTRPASATRPPVVLFVQWLSCDTVEASDNPDDGWSQMMRGIVRESGWAVMRTEKRGVGDSEGGPCAGLDYLTELRDHRAALAAVRARGDVDTDRIVLFGASMGSRMAPQVAAADPAGIIGVMTWGGGAKTWYERMLAFDRHALELGGTEPSAITAAMKQRTAFHLEYLVKQRDPREIARDDPAHAETWKSIVGSGPDTHYGRPFAFHWQAQAQDWAAAWSQVAVPALIVMGEYDWYENVEGHETAARMVNRRRPDLARFALIPRMDHHFVLFDSAEAAFRDEGGRVDARPFLDVALPWLKHLAGEGPRRR